MRKKLINEKRSELKQMDRRDLVDTICSYPNQDLLNCQEDGKRRPFPTGMVAKGIQERGYQMTDKQYYALIHNYTAATVPEMKVVGVTFYDNRPQEFQKTLMERKGTRSVYEMDYRLTPEPDNPYDANAIKVSVQKTDGSWHQIGYLNKEFAAAHPVFEEQDVKGYLRDYSNGHLKRVSYSLAMDVEALDRDAPKTYLYEATVPNKAQNKLSKLEQADGVTRARMTDHQLFVYADRPLRSDEQKSLLETAAGKGTDTFFTRVDTRTPDLELTDDMLQGLGDLSLDLGGHAQEPAPYRYERPFTTTRTIQDIGDVNQAFDSVCSELLTDSLNGNLELYGNRSPVERLGWKMETDRQGVAFVETKEPLTEAEQTVISRTMEYEQTHGHIASTMRELTGDERLEPFIPENENLTLTNGALSLSLADLADLDALADENGDTL